ncbi:hypothetical protein MLD38_003012 [Melastoma candidum]|uniref:Uncharacterized protein n=1 Tax=Melastoma candidum TaxID=119954 RepID=A0ACB9S0V5_9MYRT|nr:hypothetical protein MLD38_003012 [Melastoma candidum]
MCHWRKFEFFEERLSWKCVMIPEEVKGKVVYSSSRRGKVVLGCEDGEASLLDRGLNFHCGFQAHSASVLFLDFVLRLVLRLILLVVV